MKNITIQPVLNGFLVSAGCQNLAYTDISKLVRDLECYLRDPEETEKRLIKEEGYNAKHTMKPARIASGLVDRWPEGIMSHSVAQGQQVACDQ